MCKFDSIRYIWLRVPVKISLVTLSTEFLKVGYFLLLLNPFMNKVNIYLKKKTALKHISSYYKRINNASHKLQANDFLMRS